jgi:peptide/nickel transport system permease protein
MRAYLFKRLLLIIPTLFLVTVLVFLLVRLIPGNVIDLMVATMSKQSELGMELTAERLRHALGMDLPIQIQYGRWLWDILQGDLGSSLWTDRSVAEDIVNRLPVTFELGLISLIVALLIALPVGIYSAIRQDTIGDYIGRTIAILGISIPSFWVGTMVVVYPAIWFGWAPRVQYIPLAENPIGNLVQFVIPAVILGMAITGTTMRMTRTMMLEVLRQDYIRTAWSKGLKERTVVLRHAVKNALIPVVSMIGLLLPILIAGAVIIETIFCLPGIGLLMIEAVNKRDYPIISGINLMIATFVLVANLLVDLTYAYLDPRVQYR